MRPERVKLSHEMLIDLMPHKRNERLTASSDRNGSEILIDSILRKGDVIRTDRRLLKGEMNSELRLVVSRLIVLSICVFMLRIRVDARVAEY